MTLQQVFGRVVVVRDYNGAVGVASAVIVPPNPYRKSLMIVNDSAAVIYLTKGGEANINAGVRLNANGGVFILNLSVLGQIYTGPIAAISAGAGLNVCISEEA